MKLTNSRDSLLLNSKNAIGKSKKVAEASKEISTAGKVEGCDVLANSKSGIITFYMGCASEIIVKVKGSGKHDISIRTSPEDGMVIKLDDNGKFSVIPKRYKLKLDIVIDGALCNSYSFVIKNLPLPTTKIEIDGNTYDNKLGAPKDAKLLKVVPDIFDEQFFESCPKDAQYEIKSMVFSINGLTPISVNGSTIRFDSYRIKSRDNIQIFNINVVRSTYNGAKVPVEGNNMAVSIRVN
jgi:hypothetical protein